MTTAMIALNSCSVPRRVSDPVNRIAWRAATSQAAEAVVMNRAIFTRVTGTPTLRAALASPPEPKIQFPAVVRSSTQVARIVSPTHHRMSTRRPPKASWMFSSQVRSLEKKKSQKS